MPLRRDEPYVEYRAAFHPPIYEQHGRYFYPDGCEIPLAVVKRLLNYLPSKCREWGIPVNRMKQMRHYSSEDWTRTAKPLTSIK